MFLATAVLVTQNLRLIFFNV